MAIGFGHAAFPPLLRQRGACSLLAYTGRSAINDERVGRVCEYKGDSDADLVFEAVALPDGAPISFASPAALANAIDAVEAGRIRRWFGRQRQPQLGPHVIIAVPPDSELSLDEAIELLKRIAVHICGQMRLAVYIAIHDPAVLSPGARTRHAHLYLPLREVDEHGFVRRKCKAPFAQARRSAGPNSQPNYVAEGVHWPSLLSDLTKRIFAECAIHLVVDPPAPWSYLHWTPTSSRKDASRQIRRRAHEEAVDAQNVAAIHGPVDPLIRHVLRGRATAEVPELERLLDRFVDDESERRRRLHAILMDSDVITFACGPAVDRPTHLTTPTVHRMIGQAVEMVDRARRPGTDLSELGSGTNRLTVIAGDDQATICDRLYDRVVEKLHETDAQVLLVGTTAECSTLAAALKSEDPVVATSQSILERMHRHPLSANKRPLISRKGLVVIPAAESVDDQSLARLLIAAHSKRATVLLGYDTKCELTKALASYAADKLAKPIPTPRDAEGAAHLLHAGLLDQSIAALAATGLLSFGSLGPDDFEGVDAVVTDDPRRLSTLEAEFRGVREDKGAPGPTTQLEASAEPLQLSLGERVVFTRTDYTRRIDPTHLPAIRAGQIARVLELFPDRRSMQVETAEGARCDIDVDQFPHFRPASTLLIREASYASDASRLIIEVTDPRCVWSALLLAARRRAPVRIDPAVATDIDSLVTAGRASIPAPLPTALTRRMDPKAELTCILEGQAAPPAETATPDPQGEFEFENMPTQLGSEMPAKAQDQQSSIADPAPDRIADPGSLPLGFVEDDLDQPNTSEETGAMGPSIEIEPMPEPKQQLSGSGLPRNSVHEDIRSMLHTDRFAHGGWINLQGWLAEDAPYRDARAEEFLKLCVTDGATATLISLLRNQDQSESDDRLQIKHEKSKQSDSLEQVEHEQIEPSESADEAELEKREARKLEELDLPIELLRRLPRSWSNWELFVLRTDLRTMSFERSKWTEALADAKRNAQADPNRPRPQVH